MYYNYNPNEYTYVDGYGFVPPPPQISEQRRIRRYANGIGLAILGYFFLANLLPLFLVNFARLIFPNIRIYNFNLLAPESIYELINGITSAISLSLPFLLYILFIRMPLRVAIPLKRPKPSLAVPAVFVALGASVIGTFSSSLMSDVFSKIGVNFFMPGSRIPSSALGLTLYLLNVTIVPALVEEFVFRGCILQSLRRFGDSFALLTSSLLFSLAHLNLVQAPNALIMGLVIGYFVLRTGSIWTGILIHFINNALAVGLTLVTQNLSDENASLVLCCVYIVYLVEGILAFFYLSHTNSNLFSLKKSETLLPQHEKVLVFFTSFAMAVALITILYLTSQYIAFT